MDFTINEDTFNLDEVEEWQEDSEVHLCTIIDAGVANNKTERNPAYKPGVDMDVFMKDNLLTADGEEEYFLGLVWPGNTFFVDFTHPNA